MRAKANDQSKLEQVRLEALTAFREWMEGLTSSDPARRDPSRYISATRKFEATLRG